ncbi:hypothetical protein GCM10023238_03750 [Streptomyces heliomycini]
MNALLVAVLLSLLSAVAYAAAAVAQERLASRSSGAGALRLLTDGAWWWAVALNASAALLHVVALAYGPLTVVQPLGALTLVAAVAPGGADRGAAGERGEWRGTAFTLAGLAAVLVAASGPAPDDVLSGTEALVVAGGTAALIGLLSWPGSRPGLRPRDRVGSRFRGGLGAHPDRDGRGDGPVRSPAHRTGGRGGAAVAAFAAGGLLLSQTAYRAVWAPRSRWSPWRTRWRPR